MMSFVLYHEVGHALDDIRDLGVGGNFESVADAIATVLSVRTGQPLGAIDAALYFLQNVEGSFADVHSSGADRAGDIVCWTIGSSSRIADLFSTVAADLVATGRDCVGEYADQFEFVSNLIPNLRDLPPVASLRKQPGDGNTQIEAMDELLSRLLKGSI